MVQTSACLRICWNTSAPRSNISNDRYKVLYWDQNVAVTNNYFSLPHRDLCTLIPDSDLNSRPQKTQECSKSGRSKQNCCMCLGCFIPITYAPLSEYPEPWSWKGAGGQSRGLTSCGAFLQMFSDVLKYCLKDERVNRIYATIRVGNEHSLFF